MNLFLMGNVEKIISVHEENRRGKILWNISGNCFATQKKQITFTRVHVKSCFFKQTFYFVPFHFGSSKATTTAFTTRYSMNEMEVKKIICKGILELAGLTCHLNAYIYFERPLLNFYITIGFKMNVGVYLWIISRISISYL